MLTTLQFHHNLVLDQEIHETLADTDPFVFHRVMDLLLELQPFQLKLLRHCLLILLFQQTAAKVVEYLVCTPDYRIAEFRIKYVISM